MGLREPATHRDSPGRRLLEPALTNGSNTTTQSVLSDYMRHILLVVCPSCR